VALRLAATSGRLTVVSGSEEVVIDGAAYTVQLRARLAGRLLASVTLTVNAAVPP
jgi:hypothetical protein